MCSDTQCHELEEHLENCCSWGFSTRRKVAVSLCSSMSPQTAPSSSGKPFNHENSYKSPPTSVSDQSQQGPDEVRGRRQDRERSSTLRGDEESGDDDENENARGTSKERPRKRKRSRKGLEKSFACPHEGCGKSYSRAEHLYRHQLNRESHPYFIEPT